MARDWDAFVLGQRALNNNPDTVHRLKGSPTSSQEQQQGEKPHEALTVPARV